MSIFLIIAIVVLVVALIATILIIQKSLKSTAKETPWTKKETKDYAKLKEGDVDPSKAPQYGKHYIAPYTTYVIKIVVYIGACVCLTGYVIEKQALDSTWIAVILLAISVALIMLALETRQIIFYTRKRGSFIFRNKVDENKINK